MWSACGRWQRGARGGGLRHVALRGSAAGARAQQIAQSPWRDHAQRLPNALGQHVRVVQLPHRRRAGEHLDERLGVGAAGRGAGGEAGDGRNILLPKSTQQRGMHGGEAPVTIPRASASRTRATPMWRGGVYSSAVPERSDWEDEDPDHRYERWAVCRELS